MSNLTQLSDIRNKRKRKKIIKKIISILFTFFVIIGSTYVFTKYSPKQVGTMITEFFGGKSGNGYPIDIPFSNIEVVNRKNNNLILSNDMCIREYNLTGGVTAEINHNYKQPTIEIENNYLLIYTRGMQEYSVYHNNKLVTKQEVDYPIFCADVNKNGKYVYATSSKKVQSVVIVKDKKNREIFRWQSPTKLTTDVKISSDDKDIGVGGVQTVGGKLVSTFTLMRMNEEEPVFEKTLDNQIILNIYFKDKGVEVITDTQGILYSYKGDVIKRFSVKDTPIVMFDTMNDETMFVVGDFKHNRFYEVVALDNTYDEKGRIKVNEQINDVQISDRYLYIITNNGAYIYNHTLSVGKFIPLKNVNMIEAVDSSFYTISEEKINNITPSMK